jgi:2-hydroxychromene-2-carboxylate isomerase
MGDLINLSERFAARRSSQHSRPAFFFDLACPMCYLAAERVERLLGEVEWVPAAPFGLRSETEFAQLRERAELRAGELRLPLEWPDHFPADVSGALRAASRAAETGAGDRFALAALRLAFCGGFELEDPEVLAEAAAAAGMTLEDCLKAASDPTIDATLNATSRSLIGQGVRQLPAVRVGRLIYDGERRLAEAAAVLRTPQIYNRPMAPVG